jgi:hypothetical protein
VRLVPLPSDPAQFVNLDAVVSMRTVADGPSGSVTIPTSHGDGTVAVTIGDAWTVELDTETDRFLWQQYAEPAEAKREMDEISRFAWAERRMARRP